MKNKGKLPEAATSKPDKQKGMRKEDIQKNPDEHIDQDFPGFPHPPAKEKTINPETEEDKANANLKKQDTTSVGSADAFEETENKEVLRAELENDDDHDKGKKEKNDKTHY